MTKQARRVADVGFELLLIEHELANLDVDLLTTRWPEILPGRVLNDEDWRVFLRHLLFTEHAFDLPELKVADVVALAVIVGLETRGPEQRKSVEKVWRDHLRVVRKGGRPPLDWNPYRQTSKK